MSLTAIPPKRMCQEDMRVPLQRALNSMYSMEKPKDPGKIIQMVNKTREKAILVSNLQGTRQSSITALSEYLGVVIVLENYLDATKSKPFRFLWPDTGSKDKPITYNSLKAEKLCLLYNLGSAYSHFGKDHDRHSDRGLKLAIHDFQMCGSIVSLLKNELGKNSISPPSEDMTEGYLKFWGFLIYSQLQQCLYEKAILGKYNRSLLAQLAKLVSQSYESTSNHAIVLGDKIPTNLVHWLKIQNASYLSVSYYHQSMQERENYEKIGMGIGNAIAGLRKSLHICAEASKLAEKHRLRLDDLQLKQLISFKLKDFELENRRIAHELIPEEHKIEPPEASQGVPLNDLSFSDVVNKNINGQDKSINAIQLFFSRILPLKINKMVSNHKTLITEIFTSASKDMESTMTEVQCFLSENGLPYILKKSPEFPEALWERVITVRFEGGFPQIRKRLDALVSTSTETQRQTTRLRKKLGRDPRKDYSIPLSRIESAETQLKALSKFLLKLKADFQSIQHFGHFESSKEKLTREMLKFPTSSETISNLSRKMFQALEVSVIKLQTLQGEMHNLCSRCENLGFRTQNSEMAARHEMENLLGDMNAKNVQFKKQLILTRETLEKCRRSWDVEGNYQRICERSKWLLTFEDTTRKIEELVISMKEGKMLFSQVQDDLEKTERLPPL